jgi:ribosomal protein S27AE
VASSSQRAYRANCPNCGAAVEFASAASASAVCSFCRSTLVRDGEALKRIGVSAELFDDHSPLQLGVSGKYQGVGFTLVGRLQYAYAGGTWNEWHALFDTAASDNAGSDSTPRSGWLSEDNGAYVIAFEAPLPPDAPPLTGLHVGRSQLFDGRSWDVASVVRTHLQAAQGELPAPPKLQGEFTVVDLRNATGEVGTLDDALGTRLQWSVGRSVALSELALQGLRDVAEKTLGSRGVACPSCGSALAPTLASSQSISCGQCHAVVDLSVGVGGELAHFAQNNAGSSGLEPQLPLGRTGTLALGGAPMPWQVVGYLERCELPSDLEAGADEEYTYWREYLLYNRTAGFVFLVDSEDGWSWSRPITGVPKRSGTGTMVWGGTTFLEQYRYTAKVTWVLGEFYWRVQRDETALVGDYHGTATGSQRRLSREESAGEVTWSEGAMLAASDVAKAFGLSGNEASAIARDVSPLSTLGEQPGAKLVRWVIVLLVLSVLVAVTLESCSSDSRCDDTRASFGENSAEYRQCLNNRSSGSSRSSGGSYGGYSSGGGGHK